MESKPGRQESRDRASCLLCDLGPVSPSLGPQFPISPWQDGSVPVIL